MSKSEYRAPRKPFRIFSARRVLLILLLGSIAQYSYTGSVNWLTDSFRWIESTARLTIKNPRASLDQTSKSIEDLAGRVGRSVPQSTISREEAGKPSAEISWSSPGFDLSGRVIKVADGDTITIVDAQRAKHKIRLFGIDSPEYDQPHYRAAKNAINTLVSGKSVAVDVKDTDSYGRAVGIVYVDGTNVNLAMIRAGHAWWYEYYAPFNRKFREGQEHAKANKLGLWEEPDPVAPWDWRRRR